MISWAKKAYFRNVLIAEGGWGPVAESGLHHGLFECGKCSIDDHTVWHNVLGQHLHISKTDLIARIENAPFDELDTI